MNVIFTEKAKREQYERLLEATKVLEEVLGPSAKIVSAEWDRGENERGRIVYTLKVRDYTGEVSAAFDPDELRSLSDLRYRLLRLWGDLLQIRSHKQLQELTESSGRLGE